MQEKSYSERTHQSLPSSNQLNVNLMPPKLMVQVCSTALLFLISISIEIEATVPDSCFKDKYVEMLVSFICTMHLEKYINSQFLKLLLRLFSPLKVYQNDEKLHLNFARMVHHLGICCTQQSCQALRLSCVVKWKTTQFTYAVSHFDSHIMENKVVVVTTYSEPSMDQLVYTIVTHCLNVMKLYPVIIMLLVLGITRFLVFCSDADNSFYANRVNANILGREEKMFWDVNIVDGYQNWSSKPLKTCHFLLSQIWMHTHN